MRKVNFYIAIILALCFTSCETVVEIEVPYEGDRLVVNSLFPADTTLAIELHRSKFVLAERGDGFEPVTGATAILLNASGEKLDEMSYIGNGTYRSDVIPEPGKIYRIKVSKEGFETVTAKNRIPDEPARITRYETKPIDGFNYQRLTIWLDDPRGEDFYELSGIVKTTHHVQRPDTAYTWTNIEQLQFQTTDPIFQNFYLDNEVAGGRFLIFDDDLFNGSTAKIELTFFFGACVNCGREHEVTFYLRKISEAYYRYKKTKKMQDQRKERPFAEPVPVYDNIKNGYGIFAGYNVTAYPIKIE